MRVAAVAQADRPPLRRLDLPGRCVDRVALDGETLPQVGLGLPIEHGMLVEHQPQVRHRLPVRTGGPYLSKPDGSESSGEVF
jgi:hypothetical protein